jgi:hypothetical protein
MRNISKKYPLTWHHSTTGMLTILAIQMIMINEECMQSNSSLFLFLNYYTQLKSKKERNDTAITRIIRSRYNTFWCLHIQVIQIGQNTAFNLDEQTLMNSVSFLTILYTIDIYRTKVFYPWCNYVHSWSIDNLAWKRRRNKTAIIIYQRYLPPRRNGICSSANRYARLDIGQMQTTSWSYLASGRS